MVVPWLLGGAVVVVPWLLGGAVVVVPWLLGGAVVVVPTTGVTVTVGEETSDCDGSPEAACPASNVYGPAEPGSWAASYSKVTLVPGSRFPTGTTIIDPCANAWGVLVQVTKPGAPELALGDVQFGGTVTVTTPPGPAPQLPAWYVNV